MSGRTFSAHLLTTRELEDFADPEANEVELRITRNDNMRVSNFSRAEARALAQAIISALAELGGGD